MVGSKMAPMIPASRYPCPCMWTGPSYLFLTDRILQNWWNATLRLGYKENMATFLCSLANSFWGKSAHTLWTGLSLTWQGNKGGLQPPVSRKLSYTVQQPTRNWILLTAMWDIGSPFSSVWALRWLQSQPTHWLQPCDYTKP